MNDEVSEIVRARELLRTSRHAAMATVNQDGSPHNTPFLFLHDETLTTVYWGSYPESQHSKNILRTGQLFVVLFDVIQRGGLYIRAAHGHILTGKDLDKALNIHNSLRIREGKKTLTQSYYTGQSPQRMWSATIEAFWVNSQERDESGLLVKDYRIEITADDLLS